MAQSEPDDPKTWSIDRVVYEFCHNDTPPWSNPNAPPGNSLIPDRHTLEDIFRKNHIDGETLLALGLTELKEELGIKSYSVNKKVLTYLQEGLATPDITRSQQSHLAHSNAFNGPEIRPSIEPHHVFGSPSFPTLGIEQQTWGPPSSLGTNRHVSHPLVQPASSYPQLQQPMLNPPPAILHGADSRHPSFVSEPITSFHNAQPRTAGSDNIDARGSNFIDKSLDTKQPTGYLDVLDATIDQDLTRRIDSPIDHLPRPAPQNPQQTPHSVLKPKKRIAPTLVSTADPRPIEAEAETKTDTAFLHAEPNDLYLGAEPLPMQDTFHVDEQDDNKHFLLLESDEPRGLSIAVTKRILNSYRAAPAPNKDSPLILRKSSSRHKLRDPAGVQYLSAFGPNRTPPVHTIQDWPSSKSPDPNPNRKLHAPKSVKEVRLQVSPESSRLDDDASSSLDEFDWILRKYPPVQVDEEADGDVLPLYGDSGDENEYDEDTWAEIDAEKQAIRRSSNVLTPEQVSQAIDEALEDIRKSWFEKKLPKVLVKAYNLWMAAARTKIRSPQIQEADYQVIHARDYLKRVREIILRDAWSKPSDVKFQCQSMEETMNRLLENEHFIRVLQNDVAPEKPTRPSVKIKVQERKERQDDEETIGSDSEIALDDFIVEDTPQGDVPETLVEDNFNPVIPFEDKPQKTLATPDNNQSPEHVLLPQEPFQPATRKEHQAPTQNESQEPTQGEPEVPNQDDNEGSIAEEGDIDSDTSTDSVLSTRARRARKKGRIKPRDTPQHIARPVYDSDTSDLDAGPRLPKTPYRELGRTRKEAIDLTYSDEVDPAAEGHNTTDFDIKTPELNPSDSPDVKIENEVKRRATKFKLIISPASKSPSTQPHTTQLIRDSNEPDLDDIKGIRQLDWGVVEERSDYLRALRKIVYILAQAEAEKLQRFVRSFHNQKEPELRIQEKMLRNGLLSFSTEDGSVSGVIKDHQPSARLLASLFATYVCSRDLVNNYGPSQADLNMSFEQISKGCVRFYEQTKSALVAYLQFLSDSPEDKKSASKHQKKQEKRKLGHTDFENDDSKRSSASPVHLSGEDDAEIEELQPHHTPHKKRKRPVAQSQEAIAQQRSDKQRIKEQELRRAQMEKKLATMSSDKTAQHNVNFQDPLVSLHRHIAQRVKPHQLDGIRFMWREVIEDPKHQGCLLAHTMGLGKTMQVISLLVTITECIKSDIQDIRAYIPPHLLANRILILCPPTLLENWFDELLMWAPEGVLGSIRKISSSADVPEIKEWAESQGILLLSYDLFRLLLRAQKSKSISKFKKEELEDWLLNGPSLVIADEAHRMKNAKSQLTMTAVRFKTLSRIALTGSPLNNHLDEYHTMISWVAPGYLGNIQQFKSKYSEPINQGLYADSTAYERRLCLKKLHVLKRDLEPKVHRADISAIQKDMPPKTEYFLTITLTEMQREAYDLYVNRLLETHNDGVRTTQAKLFTWLGDLWLLCNHPSCFVTVCDGRRLIDEERQDTGAESGIEVADVDDKHVSSPDEEVDPFDSQARHSRNDMTAMEKAATVFDDARMWGTLDDVGLSYRTVIVKEIIEKAAAIGDKTLVFSHSIPTLNYLEDMVQKMNCVYMRIDGSTNMTKRQQATKEFNKAETDVKVFLISTRAGGLGLNLQGSNRVVLFDFNFNPMWEEQAVGRAYRLGQCKPVFVYRFRAGGTFEDVINNKALFKTQLFQRVVDKKNPERYAKKTIAEFLAPPTEVQKKDYVDCLGKDPEVLDSIIEQQPDVVRNIELTETFQREDDEKLTEEELKAANEEAEDEQLRRDDYAAWEKKHSDQQRPFMMKGPAPMPGWISQGPFQGSQSTAGHLKYQGAGVPVKLSGPVTVLDARGMFAGAQPVTGQARAPSPTLKMPQRDGAQDNPSVPEVSSGDETPKSPSCKAQ